MSKPFKHALLAGTAAAALAIGTAGPASAVVFQVNLGFALGGFDGVSPTTLDGSASFTFEADPNTFGGLDNIPLDSLFLSPGTIGGTPHDTSNTVGAVSQGLLAGRDALAPGEDITSLLTVAIGGSAGGGVMPGWPTSTTDEDDFGILFFAKAFSLQEVVDNGGASLFFDSAFITNADDAPEAVGFNVNPAATSSGSGQGSGFISVAQIPAPGGLGFLGLGLIALGWYRRRRA